jgi:hypothetical protein
MRSDRRDVKPKATIPIVPDQIESTVRATPPPAPRTTRRDLKKPTIPVGPEEIVESRTKTKPPAPPPKKQP